MTNIIIIIIIKVTKQKGEKEMKKWRVKETFGGGLEFRKNGEGLELSPSPYFNTLFRKRVLRLVPGDIGLREACRELCRLYGDQWQDLLP